MLIEDNIAGIHEIAWLFTINRAIKNRHNMRNGEKMGANINNKRRRVKSTSLQKVL